LTPPPEAPEGPRPGPPWSPDVKIEKSSKPTVVGSFLEDNFMLKPKITVPYGSVWLVFLIFELKVRIFCSFGPGRTFIRFLLQNYDTLCKYDNPVYHFKDNFMENSKITIPFMSVWVDFLIFALKVRVFNQSALH